MTVVLFVRRPFKVSKGDMVRVHAAAGGVGLIACQWLNHIGATVIGTVGSEEKAALAKAHGCHHTINYREENFVERVKDLTDGKRSEEHTSELQSLMRISYAVFCLKKKIKTNSQKTTYRLITT